MDEYALGRNYEAISRLNYQLFLMRRSLPFTQRLCSHGMISKRVTDVAAGLPVPLISLEIWEMFSGLPSSLSSSYDVVHVCLARSATTAALLKPGIFSFFLFLAWKELQSAGTYFLQKLFSRPWSRTPNHGGTESFLANQNGWISQLEWILLNDWFPSADLYQYRDDLSDAKAILDYKRGGGRDDSQGDGEGSRDEEREQSIYVESLGGG